MARSLEISKRQGVRSPGNSADVGQDVDTHTGAGPASPISADDGVRARRSSSRVLAELHSGGPAVMS